MKRLGTVIVLRHGETPYNANRMLQGHLDTPLAQVGVDQARRLGEHFAKSSEFGQPRAVIASDLRRARETAAALAAGVGIQTVLLDRRLRETCLGDWQGLTWRQVERHDAERHRLWEHCPLIRTPSGESGAERYYRVSEALHCAAELAMGGGVVFVVAHGGVLTDINRMARRVPHGVSIRVHNPNTGWGVLRATLHAPSDDDAAPAAGAASRAPAPSAGRAVLVAASAASADALAAAAAADAAAARGSLVPSGPIYSPLSLARSAADQMAQHPEQTATLEAEAAAHIAAHAEVFQKVQLALGPGVDPAQEIDPSKQDAKAAGPLQDRIPELRTLNGSAAAVPYDGGATCPEPLDMGAVWSGGGGGGGGPVVRFTPLDDRLPQPPPGARLEDWPTQREAWAAAARREAATQAAGAAGPAESARSTGSAAVAGSEVGADAPAGSRLFAPCFSWEVACWGRLDHLQAGRSALGDVEGAEDPMAEQSAEEAAEEEEAEKAAEAAVAASSVANWKGEPGEQYASMDAAGARDPAAVDKEMVDFCGVTMTALLREAFAAVALDLSAARIVDVGCGSGGKLSVMEALGVKAHNIYGVDLSRKALEQCRELHPAYTVAEVDGVRWEVSEVFPELGALAAAERQEATAAGAAATERPFDVAFLCATLVHIPYVDREAFFATLRRAARYLVIVEASAACGSPRLFYREWQPWTFHFCDVAREVREALGEPVLQRRVPYLPTMAAQMGPATQDVLGVYQL